LCVNMILSYVNTILSCYHELKYALKILLYNLLRVYKKVRNNCRINHVLPN
jgi:hypothetical protein